MMQNPSLSSGLQKGRDLIQVPLVVFNRVQIITVGNTHHSEKQKKRIGRRQGKQLMVTVFFLGELGRVM